jgi:hypothetical protein
MRACIAPFRLGDIYHANETDFRVIGYRALFPANRSPSLILADQHHPPAQFYWSVEMVYIGLWSNLGSAGSQI